MRITDISFETLLSVPFDWYQYKKLTPPHLLDATLLDSCLRHGQPARQTPRDKGRDTQRQREEKKPGDNDIGLPYQKAQTDHAVCSLKNSAPHSRVPPLQPYLHKFSTIIYIAQANSQVS